MEILPICPVNLTVKDPPPTPLPLHTVHSHLKSALLCMLSSIHAPLVYINYSKLPFTNILTLLIRKGYGQCGWLCNWNNEQWQHSKPAHGLQVHWITFYPSTCTHNELATSVLLLLFHDKLENDFFLRKSIIFQACFFQELSEVVIVSILTLHTWRVIFSWWKCYRVTSCFRRQLLAV